MAHIYHKKTFLRWIIQGILLILFFGSCSLFSESLFPKPAPKTKLPVGMNIPSVNYYTTALVFTDVMKTASNMLTFHGNEWDTRQIAELEIDDNGYPLYLPQPTPDGHNSSVRFSINNYYTGRYRIYFDGEGVLGGRIGKDENGYYVDLDGSGSNTWINILSSKQDNHIRNIRILPENIALETYIADEEGPKDLLFNPDYVNGLKGFHVLRFMDWTLTNNSLQMEWTKDEVGVPVSHDSEKLRYSRVTKDYYSQGTDRGASYYYAAELCKKVGADAWVCVPHLASDNYITQMAEFWHNSGVKVYLEASNEMWNWQFDQAEWILNNGKLFGTPDASSEVQNDLANLGFEGENHPEKDAYMMARVFHLWEEVYGSENIGYDENGINKALVRVATGQHAWAGNSQRILEYLNDPNQKYGTIGCDALSVGGYFGFGEEIHNKWLSNWWLLSEEIIYRDIYDYFIKYTVSWTMKTAEIARSFDLPYLVYEGGQHLQPYQQKDWDYNQSLWDFQIQDSIYDLYMHNFNLHTDKNVDCKLFMAYSYIGERQSKYGSWGHLENLSPVRKNNFSGAPKFRALLDINKN